MEISLNQYENISEYEHQGVQSLQKFFIKLIVPSGAPTTANNFLWVY